MFFSFSFLQFFSHYLHRLSFMLFFILSKLILKQTLIDNGSIRIAKAYERPRETKDCSPQVIEEYILEALGSQGEVRDHIKLSILQRPATSEYLGELYMDKNHREGEKNGSSCRYVLHNFLLI